MLSTWKGYLEFDKVDFSYLTESMLIVIYPQLGKIYLVSGRSEDSEIKTTPSIQEKAKS